MNILIQTKYTHRQTCKQTQAHEHSNPEKNTHRQKCEQTQAHEHSNPDKIHTQTNM